MYRTMPYILTAMLLAGCGGAKTGPSLNGAGMPDFIQNPPRQSDALFGMGIADLGSVQISRETADLRARREIASALSLKVEKILTEYLGQAGIGSKAEVKDFAKSITRTLSDAELSGVSIEKREAFNGKIYSLAKYPLDDSMKKLVSDAVGREVSSRKEFLGWFREKRAFEDLDRELDKIKVSK
jgi:hypothetical protein